MAPGRYPERSERPVDTFPDLTGRMAVAQITDHIVFNVVVVQKYRDSRQLLIWAPYHDLIHKCNYRFKYYNAFYCERLLVQRCIANKTARFTSSVRGLPYLRYFWPFQNGPDVFKGPPFCTSRSPFRTGSDGEHLRAAFKTDILPFLRVLKH